MALTSQYWQMVMLTSAGQRQIKEIPSARHWSQSRSEAELTRTTADNRQIQTDLWQRWHDDEEDSLLALLCLRCWISHQIAATCYQLASQFGTSYGFRAADLWPLVLDDDGRLEPIYQPLSLKILERYDPTQASLSTWASRMTKSHPEINRFCLERGLYRISDWALLNDTAVNRLARALTELSAMELAKKSSLLAAYHRVYRRDRIAQRQQTGRASRCQEPTDQQLLEMRPHQPPAVVLRQLCELASQLRAHRVAVRRGMPLTASFDAVIENQPYDQGTEESSVAQDDFIQRYRSHFLSSLDEAIVAVTLSYAQGYERRQPSKGKLFCLALQLFHCEGQSMSAIAQQIGLSSQVQVTRLLRLKRFRVEVCAHWFNQLKQQVKAEALQFIPPERLSAITQQLEKILTEETEAVITEAAAEAQIAKNRETKSTFARRLCARLPALKV